MDPSTLTEKEKRAIAQFCQQNEDVDFGELAEFLTMRLGRTVTRDVVYSVYTESLLG